MKKHEMKPGTVGAEIQRLMVVGTDDGIIPPMLTGGVIGFMHFLMGLIAFSKDDEEAPDFGYVWDILAGHDIMGHIRLYRTLTDFLPYWFDSPAGEELDCFEAEKICDTYNEFVKKKRKVNNNAKTDLERQSESKG